LGRAREWLRSGGRRRLSRFLLKLLPSVMQSEVFDRYLALRAARGLNELFAGEVVRLEGSSAHFQVEDAELERPRLSRSEIHLTGPMPGPKMRAARGLPEELEREAMVEAQLDAAMLQVLADFAPGARRDLLVRPQELEVEAPQPGQLLLKFGLPAGSYATVLVREFTRAARLAPEERSGE
jgi:tRNA pseudouridine13 synthase